MLFPYKLLVMKILFPLLSILSFLLNVQPLLLRRANSSVGNSFTSKMKPPLGSLYDRKDSVKSIIEYL
ncbi:hypothetical protein A7K93_04075 [Candidatus Methylacidiphilum fumarolicum]|nr:hypothetical protein A7K73_02340 [Candidatus Methylacidiphilum fumarolicum]TFE74202.1 hypothetical protein A7K93_04075 [Candidatus Methylacidiphilum fumarolicum]TFE75701.1 hypothetical protein A7K72_00755 [Candidatus Methylacidiphilum fumarolicum]TFE75861.1 hypothetical protein A7D33_00970 [Candidatus Methylacidiphilum fumarolicum]